MHVSNIQCVCQSSEFVITAAMAMVGVAVCAIPDCGNPCFVDQQGKVFECCGYTHAMELQRRKAMAGGKHDLVAAASM